MTRRTVINAKYLPTKLPIVGTAFWLFLLDYYQAPGWAWGAVITIMVIFWPLLVFLRVNEKQVDIKDVEARE